MYKIKKIEKSSKVKDDRISSYSHEGYRGMTLQKGPDGKIRIVSTPHGRSAKKKEEKDLYKLIFNTIEESKKYIDNLYKLGVFDSKLKDNAATDFVKEMKNGPYKLKILEQKAEKASYKGQDYRGYKFKIIGEDLGYDKVRNKVRPYIEHYLKSHNLKYIYIFINDYKYKGELDVEFYEEINKPQDSVKDSLFEVPTTPELLQRDKNALYYYGLKLKQLDKRNWMMLVEGEKLQMKKYLEDYVGVEFTPAFIVKDSYKVFWVHNEDESVSEYFNDLTNAKKFIAKCKEFDKKERNPFVEKYVIEQEEWDTKPKTKDSKFKDDYHQQLKSILTSPNVESIDDDGKFFIVHYKNGEIKKIKIEDSKVKDMHWINGDFKIDKDGFASYFKEKLPIPYDLKIGSQIHHSAYGRLIIAAYDKDDDVLSCRKIDKFGTVDKRPIRLNNATQKLKSGEIKVVQLDSAKDSKVKDEVYLGYVIYKTQYGYDILKNGKKIAEVATLEEAYECIDDLVK